MNQQNNYPLQTNAPQTPQNCPYPVLGGYDLATTQNVHTYSNPSQQLNNFNSLNTNVLPNYNIYPGNSPHGSPAQSIQPNQLQNNFYGQPYQNNQPSHASNQYEYNSFPGNASQCQNYSLAEAHGFQYSQQTPVTALLSKPNDVKYISDSETNSDTSSDNEKKKPNRRKVHNNAGASQHSSSQSNPRRNSAFNSQQVNYGKMSQTHRPSRGVNQGSLVSGIDDLGVFGKFKVLPPSSSNYKMINDYVQNSHGVDKSCNKVEVHGIFELDIGKFKKILHFGSKFFETNNTLLWVKTSPDSVQRLVLNHASWTAYYDRMSRAFACDPRNLTGPLRQTLLLCEVSLGNIKNSNKGFKYWSQQPPLKDCNSVLAFGKKVPCKKESTKSGIVDIPNGKTIPHMTPENTSLIYNEYLIHNANQVTVKYAVDVSIVPIGHKVNKQMYRA